MLVLFVGIYVFRDNAFINEIKMFLNKFEVSYISYECFLRLFNLLEWTILIWTSL